MLGGSSALNGLLYVRGQAADYDAWGAQNPGWSFAEVLPYFKKSEDQERGADEFHGVGGPQKVADIRLRREVTTAFIEAARQAGIPANDDVNGASQEGVGYFQLTTHRGRRWSTASGYLRPAMSRANLRVVTGAQVTRLCVDGGRVGGVEYVVGGRKVMASATCETVLSAGAIGSPQLLQLSGIGDASLCREFGIAVACDLPGVGKNLRDHLQIRAVYKCRRGTLNDEINHPLRKLLMALQYLFFRSGPLTMAASQVVIFTHSGVGDNNRPDIQFHFQPLSSDSPGEGVHPFSAFTSSVCQLRPSSSGSVAIASNDPFTHPSLQAELSRHRIGLQDRRRRDDESVAQNRLHAGVARTHHRRIRSRRKSTKRRATFTTRPQHRNDNLSPGRHLQNGTGNGQNGGGKSSIKTTRLNRITHRRRIHHARHNFR